VPTAALTERGIVSHSQRRALHVGPEIAVVDQAESMPRAQSMLSKTVIDLYKTREVVDLLDLSRRQLQYWAKTGLIEPSARTPGGHHRYSFDDLVALKATKRLIDAGVSVQKIRKSVHALQALLPQVGRPLSELVLVATGDVVLVFREDTVFEAISGQEWVFEVAEFQREVAAYRDPSLAFDAVQRETISASTISASNTAASRSESPSGSASDPFSGPTAESAETLPAKPGPRAAKRLGEDWSQTG
jgi:DNA-binding transcriptional MerR regulator